jgi:hypothetical protein
MELCEKGLYVELGAYKYHVFIDFREIQDNPWHHYAQLSNSLNGRGVPSIEEALKERLLQPLQSALRELVNADMFRRLMEARLTQPQAQLDQGLMEEIEEKMIVLLREVKQLSGGREDERTAAQEIRYKLEAILYLPIIASRYPQLQPKGIKSAAEYLHKKLTDSIDTWGTLFSWLFVHALGKVINQKEFEEQSYRWIDEWGLGKTITSVLTELGLEEAAARRIAMRVKLLTRHHQWFKLRRPGQEPAYLLIETLLKDGEVQQFLKVNQYRDILWFNKEAFEEMLWWLMLIGALEISSDPIRPAIEMAKALEECYAMIQTLQKTGEKSEYQVEKLLEAIRDLAAKDL